VLIFNYVPSHLFRKAREFGQIFLIFADFVFWGLRFFLPSRFLFPLLASSVGRGGGKWVNVLDPVIAGQPFHVRRAHPSNEHHVPLNSPYCPYLLE
jgi:hypothetical protein